MITLPQALLLLETLAAYLRPPDGYLRPAGDGLPSGKAIAAKVLAAALNQAGIGLADAEAAVLGYIAEPDPGTYPKPWPDAGKLLARTSAGRAAAFLGGDADAERAWADFRSRMQALAFRPDRDAPDRHLDPADPWRNDAMFAAMSALSAPMWWGDADRDPIGYQQRAAAWMRVYRETRRGQARDADALRLTAGAMPRLLAGPVA